MELDWKIVDSSLIEVCDWGLSRIVLHTTRVMAWHVWPPFEQIHQRNEMTQLCLTNGATNCRPTSSWHDKLPKDCAWCITLLAFNVFTVRFSLSVNFLATICLLLKFFNLLWYVWITTTKTFSGKLLAIGFAATMRLLSNYFDLFGKRKRFQNSFIDILLRKLSMYLWYRRDYSTSSSHLIHVATLRRAM